MADNTLPTWHGTTILCVRKNGSVVIAGDGQVSLGDTVIKGNARKVRTLGDGSVIAGFAGATADAFTLFERLEGRLEQYPGQLTRACVEMAKDWRTDRYLRRLEAMMTVADTEVSLVLTGTGDVLEPEYGVIGIGSGGNYALAAARALYDRARKQAYFLDAMNALAGGALVPVPGGVLIRDGAGVLLGAAGVTGDNSDNDEICAVAGIEAAGLVADTG